MQQIPLDIAIEPAPSLTNYIAGANGELIFVLERMLETASPQFIYLWGESGVGKTHLAQAICPLEDGVPQFHVSRARYAVDDVDTLTEEGLDRLFELMNNVRSHPGTILVMTGKLSPAERFVRPDVCSRLTWGPVYKVEPIGEHMWEALLEQARARGIVVTPEAESWMKIFLPRDIKVLSHIISEIDRDLFIHKKGAVTVPALKRWVAEHEGF